jgi:hypothetical protein
MPAPAHDLDRNLPCHDPAALAAGVIVVLRSDGDMRAGATAMCVRVQTCDSHKYYRVRLFMNQK